jgi:hypothetical protein
LTPPSQTRQAAAVLLATPDQLRYQIRSSTTEGDTLDAIEHDLIEPTRLSDDEKSGLWLYAWSSRELGRFRRGAPEPGELSARS